MAVSSPGRRTSCRVHGSPCPGDLGGEGGRPRSPVVTSEVKEEDPSLPAVTSEVKIRRPESPCRHLRGEGGRPESPCRHLGGEGGRPESRGRHLGGEGKNPGVSCSPPEHGLTTIPEQPRPPGDDSHSESSASRKGEDRGHRSPASHGVVPGGRPLFVDGATSGTARAQGLRIRGPC